MGNGYAKTEASAIAAGQQLVRDSDIILSLESSDEIVKVEFAHGNRDIKFDSKLRIQSLLAHIANLGGTNPYHPDTDLYLHWDSAMRDMHAKAEALWTIVALS